MWLTLLVSLHRAPMHLAGSHELIVQEAEWFWEVGRCMKDKIQFLHFFMCFLSNPGRSANLFVGSAISITHFAQVCAQNAWRGILVSDRPFGSENWKYVHSAIPNALSDNIPDRLLVYLNDMLNLLIPGDAPYEKSLKLADEVIIQNIKVSQIPISLIVGSLNRNIFIRHTKMRIDDITDLLNFVEATVAEDKIQSRTNKDNNFGDYNMGTLHNPR